MEVSELYNHKLDSEKDDGNIEYKLKLINLDDNRFERRVTQMIYRINEGNGEAFYHIGRSDDGTPIGLSKDEYNESVMNLKKIINTLNCIITIIDEKVINDSYIGEFLIREKNNYVDIKIGVAGNVDAGKSTTIGTLTKGILDDGRGRARTHVFNHKHEINSGRTSSIGHQILGFDIDGNIINSKSDRITWPEIVSQSNKVITFFDLAGHERYLRTTIYGLSTIYPDYCMIMIGANMGINHMTKEHIGLCINLKIPFFIVISKIDIVPENILEENIKKIINICKIGAKKKPYLIKNHNDIIEVIRNIKSDSIVPIIQISNVTNYNLDLLKSLLNYLPIRNNMIENESKPIEFLIDNTYSVNGHPVIVSGLLKSGTINTSLDKTKSTDVLAIGPFYDGTYRQVKLRTMHNKFKEVTEARSGSYICISLKGINRKDIKKGMVLVSNQTDLKIAVREFWAHIHILNSPTTIKIGYEPFIHVDQVRQSVTINEIKKISKDTNKIEVISNQDENILRTGDLAFIKLRFINKPEYIKSNMKLIFREGKVKAFGKVIDEPTSN